MKKTPRNSLIGLAVVVAAAAAYRHFVLLKPLIEQVRAQLSDPESAQFQDLRLYSDWTVTNSALCGQVNAKNKLGGYVGFRHFQSFGEGPVRIESSDEAELYGEGRLKRCDFAALTPWWGVPF